MTSIVPTLYVEGADDVGVINALLSRHGINTDRGRSHLLIKDMRGDDRLLDGMLDAARSATDRPVGFVLDIDQLCGDRWQAVCDRLAPLTLNPPASCPPDGYIGTNTDYGQHVGVWLMPDCVTNYEKLEHLCRTLLPPQDVLWHHVKTSTDEAVRLVTTSATQRPVGPADLIKAYIHTWLAWQEEPGKPLGAAINARYLGHDSPQAIAFLRWLKQLFTLDLLHLPIGQS